jgi:hypothetical protein
MELKYIKSKERDTLKSSISTNLHFYKQESNHWISDFIGYETWTKNLTFSVENPIKLKIPQGSDNFDIDNVKILYEALKKLPLSTAIDERFWAYQTHVDCFDYMRARWPLDRSSGEDPTNYVIEHYFFSGTNERSILRNGMARLWWYGYLTYDENRPNRFELTEVLLKNLRIAGDLLERAFHRNRKILKVILSIPLQNKLFENIFFDSEVIRDLCRHLNLLGGVTVLDSLDENDIRYIVEQKLNEHLKRI